MILREIKNMYIKNRLTEGVDFVRKEWLVQDENGGAYIDTKINDLTDFSKIKVHYYVTGNPSRIFGREAMNSVGGGQCLILIGSNNTITHFYCPKGYKFKNVDKDQTMNIDFDNQQATLNNTTVSVTLDRIVTSQTMKVFTRYPNEAKAGVKFAGVTFTTTNGEILHFVPCQLLHAIPAALDANNIARSAGECGMYDSVSGKFYGNVANSGTFTVEGDVEPETHTGLQQIYQNRLIEGVDYETYDWLKADIPISTSMMSLPINSRNFEFKRNFIQLLNSAYFNTSNSNTSYSYYIDNYDTNSTAKFPKIWDAEERSVIYTSIYVGLGIHTIIANDNGVTISSATNTASLPWYGNPTFIRFNNAQDKNIHTIYLTSSIKVDGVIRYVPCQLLHSIPRNLDAQCKERVAGECGMIDLISGKFYGNVASSGTFTVENDSNE